MRERAELRHGRVEDAFDVVLDRHVAGESDRVAACGGYRADHARGGFGVALVVDRHVVAAGGGKLGGGGADAAAAAGDQENGAWHERHPLRMLEQ